MSEIKVVPCPDKLCDGSSVTVDGNYVFDELINDYWCGTATQAQVKVDKLTEPVETRPPAPTLPYKQFWPLCAECGHSHGSHRVGQMSAVFTCNEDACNCKQYRTKTAPAEQAAPPRPLRFKKKLYEVEAYQITRELLEGVLFASPLQRKSYPEGLHMANATYNPTDRTISHWQGYVTTAHGDKVPVSQGDWIIAELDGSGFYPCKAEIFAQTYEPAAPAAIEQARPQTPDRVRKGSYVCSNCGNTEEVEREITCWKCGKGEMIYHAAAAEPAPERTPPQVEVIQHETSKEMYFVLVGQPQVIHPDGVLKYFGTYAEASSKAAEIRARAVAVPEPAAQQEGDSVIHNGRILKNGIWQQAEPAPTPSRVKILEGVIRNFEGYQEMGRTVLYAQIETALKALAAPERGDSK